jgi:UPF0716 family protein affecting phage T7 exclusion
LIKNNAIGSAISFIQKEHSKARLWQLLTLSGFSGVLETLPILVALPLLRSLFLGHSMVQLSGQEVPIFAYGLGILFLLLLRFTVGSWSQYENAKSRIQLLSRFRIEYSEEDRKSQKISFGKKVQGVNFFLVGFSQFIPGILFTTLGLILMPEFGSTVIAILLIWSFILNRIKRSQDHAHATVAAIQQELENSDEDQLALDWKNSKLRSSKIDSINKNLRDFIIISTLILALMINIYLDWMDQEASLLSIVMYLRGLQQLFTAYLMSQQLASLKHFYQEA